MRTKRPIIYPGTWLKKRASGTIWEAKLCLGRDAATGKFLYQYFSGKSAEEAYNKKRDYVAKPVSEGDEATTLFEFITESFIPKQIQRSELPSGSDDGIGESHQWQQECRLKKRLLECEIHNAKN